MEVARQMRLRNQGTGHHRLYRHEEQGGPEQSLPEDERGHGRRQGQAQHPAHFQLGIMQITCQRDDESNSSGVYEPCPYCSGRSSSCHRGRSHRDQRKITSMGALSHGGRQGRPEPWVFLHPSTLRRLRPTQAHRPDGELWPRFLRGGRHLSRRELQGDRRVDRKEVIDPAMRILAAFDKCKDSLNADELCSLAVEDRGQVSRRHGQGEPPDRWRRGFGLHPDAPGGRMRPVRCPVPGRPHEVETASPRFPPLVQA